MRKTEAMMSFQNGGQKQRRRRSRVLWLGLIVLGVYCLISLYTAYSLIEATTAKQNKLDSPDSIKYSIESRHDGHEAYQHNHEMKFPAKFYEVEVWGKAAIGLYFWEHILEGPLETRNGQHVRFGIKTVDQIRFNFRTGPGVIPQTVPTDTENVVLIINGRVEEKIMFAEMWLNSLGLLPRLKNVAVILLGNEQCNNNWLLPYLASYGGLVHIAFIVYDIEQKYDIFQWPLGVATYRKFPKVVLKPAEILSPRTYICNFLGTMYHNSSRELLRKIFYKHKLYSKCYFQLREAWQPNESQETANEYYQALVHSDLTLCPVGINTECYRIYEACSFGSVPVIEDVRTAGNCSNTPLQLLKFYNAPFIYLKSWSDLPAIIEKEEQLTKEQKIKRRNKLLAWYQEFKRKIQQSFVAEIKKTFFEKSS